MATPPDSLSKLRSRARREASAGKYNLWGGHHSPRRAQTDLENGVSDDGTEEPIHLSQTAPEAHTDFAQQQNGEPSQQLRKRITEGTTPNSDDTEKGEGDEVQSPVDDADLDTGNGLSGKRTWKQFYKQMFQDDQIPVGQQLRRILFPRWYTINWLLVAAPVGIGLHFTSVDPLAIFIVNFIAIMPLAAMLSMATEELSLRVGEVLGGLLNASFGYVGIPANVRNS